MCYQMEPLLKDEVVNYIEYQHAIAGAKHTIIADDAIEAYASRSRGWLTILQIQP